MKGIFVTLDTIQSVHFDSPNELFNEDSFTIVGACIEEGLVFMGRANASHLPMNTNIPLEWFTISCFDEHPRGNVLIVKTNEEGEIIDHDLKL